MFLFLDLVAFVLLALAFCILSLKYKILQPKAIIASLIIGCAVFVLSSLGSVLLMLSFVVFGEGVTRAARKIRKARPHPRRALGNVIGNGGAALVALFAGSEIAFVGALSAALADTFSSEIGLLSKTKPRLITKPWKKVRPGTDGGVTLLGFAAAVVGATVIVSIALMLRITYMKYAWALIMIGIIGSIIDSIIGDIFERKGLLNNTAVNFIASGCAGLLAITLL
ncbi:MAG: DUF92 domain-containing protein [Candidatus Diapherotrites archaeon]|nr:DUF92 domain-containing protein [Candidatus Diapherotrites archaeon]